MSGTLQLAAATVPYVAVLIGIHLGKSAWTAILLYHAGILLYLWRLEGARWLRQLERGWGGALFGLLLGPCLLSGPLLYLLFPVLAPPSLDLPAALAGLGLRGRSIFLFMAYYTLVNPWLEETFWRGLLGSPSLRPTLCDVLFAGYHLLVLWSFVPWTFCLLAGLALLGAAWVWRRVATRLSGLLVPALTHLAADASVILAVYLLSSAPR